MSTAANVGIGGGAGSGSGVNPPPSLHRDSLRLPLLADAAMAVANGGAVINPSSSAAAAAPTLTTPTVTPTTLRNIEQMFMDSEGQSAVEEVRPPDPHENSARFEPPAVSIHEVQPSYNSEEDDSLSIRESAAVVDGSVLPGPHSNEQHSLPTIPLMFPATAPTAPPPTTFVKTEVNGLDAPAAATATKRRSSSNGGGRRPAATSNLTPEEEQKKILRRQRNKEAAARCRKRRLDQTVSLQEEVDKWETRKAEMEEEVKSLEVQKRELEILLESHRANCKSAKLKKKSASNNNKDANCENGDSAAEGSLSS